MKKIAVLILMVSANIMFAQTSVCGQFHRKFCLLSEDEKGGAPWTYNSQSKSGLFNKGMTSKIRCVIYKGMDYRMSVCCETVIGDVLNYKIFVARTSELLFDNSSAENTPVFEFQSTSTRQLIIEVTIPNGDTSEEKHKPSNAACVGLLIENKVSPKQGF